MRRPSNARDLEGTAPPPRASRVSLWLSALAAMLAAAALIIRWIGIPTAGGIGAASLSRLDGAGAVFVAPMPFDKAWLRPLADIPTAPHRSDLELFEDGRRLGPPHASAEGLAAGNGAYSFSNEGTEILFTTSDGSDPGENRRSYTYRVRVRASLRDAMNLGLISGLLFLYGLFRRSNEPLEAAKRFIEIVSSRFEWTLSAFVHIAWLAGGILAVWLLGSGLSSEVAAWAPLQTKVLGPTVMEIERHTPLLLLLIAAAGYLFRSNGVKHLRGARPLALVPLLFCLGYVCSIYRPEPILPLDADPYSNFLGFLPNSDAQDYYEGARHLLDVGELTAFTERRPANAAWLAIRLSLADSVSGATYVQVILVALATCYLVSVVGSIFGPWSGLAVLALTYSYSRLHFTTTLSEAPGITFGVLGTGLVLVGLRTRSTPFFAAGMSGSFTGPDIGGVS